MHSFDEHDIETLLTILPATIEYGDDEDPREAELRIWKANKLGERWCVAYEETSYLRRTRATFYRSFNFSLKQAVINMILNLEKRGILS